MTQMVMTVTNLINFSAVANFFANWKAKAREARKVKETIRELRNLSDVELNDIGLSRGDIYSVANGTFAKDASDAMKARILDDVVFKSNTNSNLRGWV